MIDKPRIGLIARMDRTGLGYQTKALFDLLKPAKTLVVDSTPFKEGFQQNPEWYHLENNALNLNQEQFVAYTKGMGNDLAFEWLVYDLDVIITCEVPYHDRLYQMARERGIKVILQPNAELNPHFENKTLDKPDYFFLPSPWLEKESRQLGVTTVLCPPPITLKPKYDPIFKHEGEVNVLHIAGKRALADRNGTQIVEKALAGLDGVNLTIRDQAVEDIRNQEDMYKGNYHVVLMPRRYGGLCLPMLEALSQGLPVVMPNIEPNNTILPKHWLMPVKPFNSSTIRTKRAIKSYTVDDREVVDAVIRFKAMNQDQFDFERANARGLYEKHVKGLDLWMDYITQIKEGKL